VHLTAKADASDLRGLNVPLLQEFAYGALAGLPPVLRILFRPPAARGSKGLVFVNGGSDDRARFIDEQGARPSRADINT
jgi:hypothetical protein